MLYHMRQLCVPIQESTSYYGELFERFIILQYVSSINFSTLRKNYNIKI